MGNLYNHRAPKKATNLSINSDLLRQVREFDINLSAVIEKALEENLQRHLQSRWREENRQAISSYNAHVDANGVFGDKLRSF